jgi:hypothetical protein
MWWRWRAEGELERHYDTAADQDIPFPFAPKSDEEIALGLIIAFPATRVLSALLFGVEATDATVFSAVAAVLLCVALAASYLPAHRATRVDPMVALRPE